MIMQYLQKIGRALMVPVSVLPAAAILMGIGYWIDPTGWGGESPIAAFLIKAGAAIIDNMGVLFAIGVSYGLSRDKDGSAALAGLVGWFVLTTLLSPGAVSQIQGIKADAVPAAFSKIQNPFIGILTGVIASTLYNRFGKVELPKFLAFFSGRRLVPILTSIVMIFVAFILMYVWPHMFGGLQSFGESIAKLGPVGAGIFGFVNRLLIPVGLHHAVYPVFWFDIAGINDIPNFLGGAKSIADGVGVPGVTGMYQAGFFPIMMFGLPGAALAMYTTAKKENKNKVLSIMLAASLASIFTGVTEPIEFAFMFVAPVLYVVHALLTGISLYVAAEMHWMAGFGFSAGFVDLMLSSRNPLATKWYMLIVQGLVMFVIYYFVFVTVIKALNLKTPGREDAENNELEADTTTNSSHSEVAKVVLRGLGGSENLTNIDNCATRLRLEVKDSDAIDEKLLRSVSAGVVKSSKTSLQVIIGTHVEFVADALKAIAK